MDNLSIYVTHDIESRFSERVMAFAQGLTGRWSFFASGGFLVPALYRKLAMNESFGLASRKMDVFLGDERMVSTESEDSNTHQLKLAFSTLLASQYPPHFHSIDGVREPSAHNGNGDPSIAYLEYERLAKSYQQKIESAPRPWLVHLGLGADGHTAGLFESSPALDEESGDLYQANYDPTGRNPFVRLTLTPKALNMTDLVVITVSGIEKAIAVRALVEGNTAFPTGKINPSRTILIADYAAASLLTNE